MAMFDIVIAAFVINDKNKKIKFFEKTLLLANISSNMLFLMLFFILNNVDVMFLKW